MCIASDECRHWRRNRSDLTEEVRKYEQIVKTNVSAKMLWGLGIACFQWKLNEVRNCEQQLEPHCGGSYDTEAWRRTLYKYQGRIAVVGSFRGVAGNFAACGWAVVQLEADGGDIPWSGMYGIIRVCVDVQRTMKRTETWTFCLAPVCVSYPVCIYTVDFGVVQALCSAEEVTGITMPFGGV